jgi:hypothetical protein
MPMRLMMALFEQQMRMLAEANERQTQMMMRFMEQKTALFSASLESRGRGELVAAPAFDPLAAVRLGMEIARPDPAAVARAPIGSFAPAVDSVAQLRANIALLREAGLLRPPAERRAPSDAAEFQASINDFVAKLTGRSVTAAAALAGEPQQAMVLIGDRLLTIEAAAAEYERLVNAQPVVAAAPATTPSAVEMTPALAAPLRDNDATGSTTPLATLFAELVARAQRPAAEPQSANALGAPAGCGGSQRGEAPVEPAGNSIVARSAQETDEALPGVVEAEEIAASKVVDGDPASSGSTSAPVTSDHEKPQHLEPIALPVRAAHGDDEAAVDRFLRSDARALAWLRSAVERDEHAALSGPAVDLSYFAQAVEVIVQHADGRARLQALLKRAERRAAAQWWRVPPTATSGKSLVASNLLGAVSAQHRVISQRVNQARSDLLQSGDFAASQSR